jgi:hypothetical protein
MHFWNKLSTGALMRLVILTSFNLLLTRLVDGWDRLLHPWFFLIVVTLNLGLYAVMVYSGTLNKTLIGMMLGGLAATLGTLAYTGMTASAFMYDARVMGIGRWVEWLVNLVLVALPASVYPGGTVRFGSEWLIVASYLVCDAAGLFLIVAGGWLGRRWQARITRRGASMSAPSP